MKMKVVTISVMIIASALIAEAVHATVIDPTAAPPGNKPQFKPIIFERKKKVLIAVIDTGIDPVVINKSKICENGVYDFSETGIEDRKGHGTHISGLIDQYAKNMTIQNYEDIKVLDKTEIDYCQIIIKFFDPARSAADPLKATIKAFELAISLNVDIINYSGGGNDPQYEERVVIEKALDAGIKIVAAAGNESANIDNYPYYPAMYDQRIFIVGNLVNAKSRSIASSSNYGKSVNTWEIGTKILSTLPGNVLGYMTGTSQATAIRSGKLVRELLFDAAARKARSSTRNLYMLP